MKKNKTIRITICFFVVIFFSLLFMSSAHAFEQGLLKKIKKSDQPVIVKGDKVEYLRGEKKVVGTGNVSVSYGEAHLSCDKIIVYTDTKEAICEGNVIISQPGALMKGNKINYNFSTKKGYALKSNIEVHPFYGSAKRIEQSGDKEFGLESGYITTSDLEKPHYRIEAKEVRIYLDEKIVAKHITLYIGNIPVLYLPLYVQPLRGKFAEVTVSPGRTSDWGNYALTAWRYFFNENSKGHVHVDYREKKGLAEGIDYSYDAKELGKGLATFYYTHENDDLTVSKSGSTDDRWRLQYRHNIELPENSMVTVEFNKLSDRNFIKDYLYREFEGNPDPDNYILFENQRQNYVLRLLARKRMNDFFNVVERLPEVELEVYNQRLWETKFYYQSGNAITNFVKRYDEEKNTPKEESLRSDNFHKLSYAAKLFNFLYTTPFVATRQTFYTRNKWKERSELRSIYEAGVNFSTKFYRIFDVTSDLLSLDIHRLRHIITPTASYLHRHQPTISPDNLFQFDAVDNIVRHNGFGLSLENKIQTKRPYGDEMKTVDLARFIVSSNYLFRLKKRSLESQGVGRFGDIRFQLELRPYTWFFFDSNMTLDRKNYDIKTANMDFYVDMGEKLTVGIGHRYVSTENDRNSQFTGEIFYNINDEWKIKVYERFDVANSKWEEQQYTLLKDLHSWLGEFSVNVRNDEYTAWLVFRLKAFPKIPIGLFETTYRRPRPGGRH
ncbi:MAG: LPS assembly protein LptD [Omnitrophica bacterium]|nr:LPS assembly protein LptD [Candidatus Omnitrophota bacterium]